ncbi:calcium-binding protein CML38 [Hevea brasiliensis]|nr:calcium-binding protein CML38 [Hevea brasiliensis]
MNSSKLSPSSSPKSALTRLRRKLSPRRSDSRSLCPSSSSSTNYATNATEIQRVFNYFDENGDGKISPHELQSCVRTLGGDLSTEDAELAVGSSDTDGDGLLGFEDFQRLMESCTSEEGKKEELKQAFGMYETEPGSGIINPNSLKRMLSRLGQSRSLDDCKAMIRTFDLNGDGVLSFHEFAVMMR